MYLYNRRPMAIFTIIFGSDMKRLLKQILWKIENFYVMIFSQWKYLEGGERQIYYFNILHRLLLADKMGCVCSNEDVEEEEEISFDGDTDSSIQQSRKQSKRSFRFS